MTALGIGTFAGAATSALDSQYDNALQWAFAHGCTFVDSSIAYRAGRALSCVSRALPATKLSIKLSVKVGFDLMFGGNEAARHSLDRSFLREQILRSVELLGDRPIDWVLLHNPETQLRQVDRSHFESLLQNAFEMLETLRSLGTIGSYGVATSCGFRVPSAHPMHLDLDRLLVLSRNVAVSHGFRAIQAPLSIDAPESIGLFAKAKSLGLITMGSSPITPFAAYERPVHPAVALAAIKWALSVQAADWVICGTLNLTHLKANLAAAMELGTTDRRSFRTL